MRHGQSTAAALLALAGLYGCPAYGVPGSSFGQEESHAFVTAGWWGGQDHYFDTSNNQSAWTGHDLDVVRDQASRDFGCPPATVVVHATDQVYLASGCARRAPYVTISLGVLGNDPVRVPGRDDLVWPTWIRAVNVVAPTDPPPAPSGAKLVGREYQRAVGRWNALVVQGAKDLECPVDQITPDYVPQGKSPDLPLAEGCGKRATYVGEYADETPKPLRLSSIVPVK
jgi:hypothetical protein